MNPNDSFTTSDKESARETEDWAQAFRELMGAYVEMRARWFETVNDNEAEFHAWFTSKVTREA